MRDIPNLLKVPEFNMKVPDLTKGKLGKKLAAQHESIWNYLGPSLRQGVPESLPSRNIKARPSEGELMIPMSFFARAEGPFKALTDQLQILQAEKAQAFEGLKRGVEHNLRRFIDTSDYVLYDPEESIVLERFSEGEYNDVLSKMEEAGYISTHGEEYLQVRDFREMLTKITAKLSPGETQLIKTGSKNVRVIKPFAVEKTMKRALYEPEYSPISKAGRKVLRRRPTLIGELTNYLTK